MRFAGLCCGFALLCLVIAGCSQGPDLSTVTGKVTLDGDPLEGASIEFQPTGEGSPSYGTTDASGMYEMAFTHDKKGAVPGEHVVRISKLEPIEGEELTGEEDEDDLGDGEETLPAKYNSNSELKETVTDGKNEFDFELESGAPAK